MAPSADRDQLAALRRLRAAFGVEGREVHGSQQPQSAPLELDHQGPSASTVCIRRISRIRWRLVPLVAVLAMTWSLLSAAPAHAAIEYLGVRDWSTFASWQAPSGNIYTGPYRASVARNTSNGNIAWRINTRCLVNGQSATCKRWFSGGARRIREQSQRVMGVSLGYDG